MRKSTLLSATSIVPIIAALTAFSSTMALADTTVTSERTTPIKTSTATSSATPDNIIISSDGSITLTTGTAITIDSDHTLTVNGPVKMANSEAGATAILIDGGHTSSVVINSTITATEDFTGTDSNSDGILDGAVASVTNHYGLHSVGSTPFIGNIETTSSASFEIEGNSSYGIRFENKIDGKFNYDSSMSLSGSDSTGISLEDGVTGNVYLSGSIATKGQNTSAIRLSGDYGGNIVIDGSYSGTGYATTSSLSEDALEDLIASDFYLGGVVVDIQGNVANGIWFGATLSGSDENISDEDGNGVEDSTQSTASIYQYGTEAAFRVASSTQDLTIGALTYADSAIEPPSVNYGIRIQGSINSYGIYENYDATAIQLSGLGNSVDIENGVSVEGSVVAVGKESNATAIKFLSGATTPQLDVFDGGGVSASTSTTGSDKATAIYIASGANLAAINVSQDSYISASASGSTGQSVAIIDESNTLSTITNSGIIRATITATDDDEDDTADSLLYNPIAIDLSSNTIGATITQIDDAVDDDDVASPYIFGDVLLGSGNDTVSSSGGAIYGDIDFGAGTNSFSLTDEADYIGKLTSAGTVSLSFTTGATAQLTEGSSLNFTDFYLDSESSLTLTLDSHAPTTPILSGTGTATFETDAEFNLTLSDIVLEATQFTVLSASTINIDDSSLTNLTGDVPYLYKVSLSKNSANTILYANFEIKTQSEGNFTDNEYSALMPVLVAAGSDADTTDSLLAPTTETGFKQVLNQFLPNYSGENLLGLSHSNLSMAESLGSLSHLPDPGISQFWLQEHGFQQSRETNETVGFDTTGFSFAGGRESLLGEYSAVGVYISYTSISPNDGYSIANETLTSSDLTVGGYWRMTKDRLKAWAHAGVGYDSFESNRQLITSDVNHEAQAKWHGTSFSAGMGASFDYPIGSFVLTPVASASYYSLKEDAYNEIGGTDSFNLYVAARTSKLASGSGIMRLRYDKWAIKPEVYIGFKTNFVGDAGETVAHFKDGADFILNGGDLTGSGVLGGIRLFIDTEWSYFSLQAGFEKINEVTDGNIELRTRFTF